MVGDLIRLKFTILGHSTQGLRITRWVVAPLAVLATWTAVLAAGSDDARHDVLLVVLALWGTGWALGPVLTSGAGVLRPEWFAHLPLNRRWLGVALMITVCVGVGPAVTLLSLAVLGAHAYLLSPPSLAVAAVALPLLLVAVVATSRVVYALLGAAMGSRLGVAMSGIQYGALIAGLMVGWVALSAVGEGIAGLVRDGLPDTAARVLEALPTSWPVLAVEAGAEGRWGTAAGLLLALAAAAAIPSALCALLLTPRTRNATPHRRRPPLGTGVLTTRPLLPDTPAWSVAGKELRQWWRDPWRSLEIQCGVWTGVFIALIGIVAGIPQMLPFAGVSVAFMVALVACNLYGQDGTALWQTVVGADENTARHDVRGRQVALLLLCGPVALLMTAVFTVLSGQHWAWPYALGLLAALLGAGTGVAVLLSVIAATPGVDPKYRIGPNDSGDVSYQVWIAMYGTGLLIIPTFAALVTGLAAGGGALAWLTVPVGLANGAGAAWFLGRLAHRRLAARLPETFVRLRHGKATALQQLPPGSDWLDRMERAATRTNTERKPVGS